MICPDCARAADLYDWQHSPQFPPGQPARSSVRAGERLHAGCEIGQRRVGLTRDVHTGPGCDCQHQTLYRLWLAAHR